MENLKVLSNKLEEFVPSDILSFEESDDNLETNLLEYISWGRSDLGTLFSNASVDHDITPITFQGSRKIIQFSSNVYHSCCITSTGDMYTCGSNEEGTNIMSNSRIINSVELKKFFFNY
jgi:alpha-tubulin suppressor-like RCC1 family protein